MFTCEIAVSLPLYQEGTQRRLDFIIARYSFDPGLQFGDEVRINDATFTQEWKTEGRYEKGERQQIIRQVEGTGPKFSFDARVIGRKKVIEPKVPEDSFVLKIGLEIADKEQMPEMVNYLKETFPGKYEGYLPSPTDEFEEE